jgi:hypothetical protein
MALERHIDEERQKERAKNERRLIAHWSNFPKMTQDDAPNNEDCDKQADERKPFGRGHIGVERLRKPRLKIRKHRFCSCPIWKTLGRGLYQTAPRSFNPWEGQGFY